MISVAKTASKKFGALIRSMKYLSPEVSLYLYKSTITHVWNTLVTSGLVPLVCNLELLDKLQKRVCRTVGPSLLTSLEPLAQHQNVASLSLVYRYYFGRCSCELAQLVFFFFLRKGLLVILIDCMIFLPPFLDVTGMSMLTVSFLTQLHSGILCL